MITPWNLYWLTRLDEINALLAICALVCIAVVAAQFIGKMNDWITEDYDEELRRRRHKVMLRWLLFALAFAIPVTFIPSTKQMAAIVVIPRIANSETVCELGQGVKELALDWLKELKPNHGNEKKEAK